MDGMTRYKVTLYDGDMQHTCKKTLKKTQKIIYSNTQITKICFKSWYFGNTKERYG
jgi:hypothetical protein